jgi:hypothetical protein
MTRVALLVMSGLAIASGALLTTASLRSSPTRASEPPPLDRSRLDCGPSAFIGGGRALIPGVSEIGETGPGPLPPEGSHGAATPEAALEQYASEVAPAIPVESFRVSIGDGDDREFVRAVGGRTTRIVQIAEYSGRWFYTGWLNCGDDR